jgi:hypothetical protein
LQKVKKWFWGVYVSYHKNTGEQMNIEDSCPRFFGAERALVRGYRSDGFASGIEGQQRVSFARANPAHPKMDTSCPQKS